MQPRWPVLWLRCCSKSILLVLVSLSVSGCKHRKPEEEKLETQLKLLSASQQELQARIGQLEEKLAAEKTHAAELAKPQPRPEASPPRATVEPPPERHPPAPPNPEKPPAVPKGVAEVVPPSDPVPATKVSASGLATLDFHGLPAGEGVNERPAASSSIPAEQSAALLEQLKGQLETIKAKQSQEQKLLQELENMK